MSFWCHRLDQTSDKNIIRISTMKFFVASEGLPKGSYKNFQGRNPYNIFVDILLQTWPPKRHFEINWPLIVENNQKANHKFRSNLWLFTYLWNRMETFSLPWNSIESLFLETWTDTHIDLWALKIDNQLEFRWNTRDMIHVMDSI